LAELVDCQLQIKPEFPCFATTWRFQSHANEVSNTALVPTSLIQFADSTALAATEYIVTSRWSHQQSQ